MIDLPPGCFFTPGYEKLVEFLRSKISHEPLHAVVSQFIHDADVYAAEPPELVAGFLPTPSNTGDIWYFFTFLKAKSSRDSRKRRIIAGGNKGKWHAEATQIDVVDEEGRIVGYRQAFTYKDNEGGKPGWHMVEFRTNREDDEGCGCEPMPVLCKIYRTPAQSASNSSSSRSERKRKREVSESSDLASSARVRRKLQFLSPPPTNPPPEDSPSVPNPPQEAFLLPVEPQQQPCLEGFLIEPQQQPCLEGFLIEPQQQPCLEGFLIEPQQQQQQQCLEGFLIEPQQQYCLEEFLMEPEQQEPCLEDFLTEPEQQEPSLDEFLIEPQQQQQYCIDDFLIEQQQQYCLDDFLIEPQQQPSLEDTLLPLDPQQQQFPEAEPEEYWSLAQDTPPMLRYNATDADQESTSDWAVMNNTAPSLSGMQSVDDLPMTPPVDPQPEPEPELLETPPVPNHHGFYFSADLHSARSTLNHRYGTPTPSAADWAAPSCAPAASASWTLGHVVPYCTQH